jgi:heat shock protein beta
MNLVKMALLGLVLCASVLFGRAEEPLKEMAATGQEDKSFSSEQAAELKSSEETFEFQAEVNRLMDILINSLYSNREIFLRELISNAADALDKVRFQSLTDKSVLGETSDLDIRLTYNKEARSITLTDKGVGMTREDLLKNLGVVAKSGTTEFVEAAAGGSDSLSLIGQFGVGFYSVYLVADKVTVVSKNNEDDQYVWESTANSVFTIAKDPRGNTLGRGTSITLHLKEDAEEFLNESELEKIVGRYSEFINFPIYLRTEKTEEKEVPIEEDEAEASAEDEKEKEEKDDEDDDLEVSEDEEDEAEEAKPKTKKVSETTYTWKLLNEAKAVWTRNPKEITGEEYNSFFKALTKETSDPLDHIHFVAEGEITFRSILYIPSSAAAGLYDKFYEKSSNLKLYVRRVLIADEFDEFLPRYLNFVRGVVDSEDLPLNVSRETLAQSRVLKVMSKKLTRKVLEMLRKMAEREEEAELAAEEAEEEGEEGEEAEEKTEIEGAEDYKTFWNAFGKSIKLGVMDDRKNKSKLTKLLRFPSSVTDDDEYTSLEAYVDRMQEDQKYIYYITGPSLEEVKKSPMLERLTKKGLEVLYMADPLDEYVVQMVTEFDGHTLQSASKSGLKIGDEDEDALKQIKAKWADTVAVIKEALAGKAGDVEISTRLESTPGVIVTGQYGWGANMRRIMNAQTLNSGGDNSAMYGKKTFEINYRHPTMRAILDKVEAGEDASTLKDAINLLYDATVVQSGFTFEDPNDFAARVNKVVAESLNVAADAELAPEDVDIEDIPEEGQETEDAEDVVDADAEEEPAEEEPTAEPAHEEL